MKFLQKPSFLGYIEELRRSPFHFLQVLPRFALVLLGIFMLLYTIASFTIFPVVIAHVIEKQPLSSVSELVQLTETQKGIESNVRPVVTPTLMPSYLPVELKIPALQLQTQIEHVGQTKTLHMDVPKNAAHVAWYVYGAKPGEDGNAVISGHYDTPSGAPAVFFRLSLLNEGDEVIVVFEEEIEQSFVVVGKERYPYKTFPNEYVFFSRPGKNLNLITCDGIWDVANAIYNDRLVVFTTAKEN